jgi:hypothetical protein
MAKILVSRSSTVPLLAGPKQGLAASLDDGEVQIRYSSSRPAAARASVSWPVPQMRRSPPSACFSRLTSSSRSGPGLCHAFVGDAAEQQCVGGERHLEPVALQLLVGVPERPVVRVVDIAVEGGVGDADDGGQSIGMT